MPDALKLRYFVAPRPVFANNRRYAAGDVITMKADECAGRKVVYKLVDGKSVAEFVSLDRPAEWMIETDSKGKPLDGSVLESRLAEEPEKPKTLAEMHSERKGKRSFDKEI